MNELNVVQTRCCGIFNQSRHRVCSRPPLGMTSSFASKLGTNYCPPDEEVTEIKTLLVGPTLRLKRLADEITEMQKVINKLAAERAELSAYVEAHKALISPVRRLPLDVMQEIFVACLPIHRNCVMSAREAPILLGRICSAWRTLSLSTPRLWASLHIVEPSRPWELSASAAASFEEKLAQRLETAKTWLGRSGHCPLSISLEGGRIPFGGPMGVTFPHHVPGLPQSSRFVEALIPFASRWRRLNIAISPMPTILSTLTEHDVPILQHVTIHERPEPGPVPETQWSSFGIFNGPQLSAFSISARSYSPTDLPVRWGQLTVLSMADITWSFEISSATAVQVLSWCPELRVCHLGIHDPSTSGSPGLISTIECAFLQTLELECVFPAFTLREMFSRLALPDLRHFKLRGYCPEESQRMLSFSYLFDASQRLESLDISTDTFMKDSLLELFRSLPPTMLQLQISHAWSPSGVHPLNDDALAVLTPPLDDPAPTCPALRDLILVRCDALSDTALVRFVESRMASTHCSRLKRVQIQFTRQRQLDLLASLRAFTDAGLDLTLSYPPPEASNFSPWLGLNEPESQLWAP
ncbi:hypothetical protein B0H15DRAFT_248071 [Mycena belliarum]|uniref:F-box domain-containing protein n=1 Tax=Mycena belliarum TaxID=1033014 RepID=A0AAD6XNC6_9AGAR|nr:hypothetical protein B0H15DRAFT_248071 [Mycena belliae]